MVLFLRLKVEFLKNQIPYTLNPGGPNHEELASLVGIAEYFEDVYNHHFQEKKINLLNKIKKINSIITNHEEKIGNKFLDFIESEKKINLIGKKKIENKNRAPTFSFTIEGMSSEKVSESLIKQKIALRNDNFYAWRCLKALGIDTKDGVVRVSMVHYNSLDDVDKLIKSSFSICVLTYSIGILLISLFPKILASIVFIIDDGGVNFLESFGPKSLINGL